MQREGFYKNGFADGIWTYWNAKGEKDFDFDFGSGLEHIAIEDAPERASVGLFYKINEDVPFTGIITHVDEETGYEFLGRVKNGKKDGQWVKWFPSGKEVPEILIVDVPVPEPKKPWSGGKQEQGGYKEGKKHGQWTEWYDNEHIKSHGEYNLGTMIGHWTFYYTNGIKEKEGSLVDGNADGLWVFYDDKSKKRAVGFFFNWKKK